MPPIRPSAEDQERLYPAIANAVLKSVPEHWKEVMLKIEADESGQIELELFGPSGVAHLQMPDDSIYEPAINLYDLFTKDARPFLRCDFRLRWYDDLESWRFEAKYLFPSEQR